MKLLILAKEKDLSTNFHSLNFVDCLEGFELQYRYDDKAQTFH